MKKIDLQGLLDANGIDSTNDLAKRLFPDAKHPYMALYRVLTNEKALLNEVQISYLASYLDLPISDLFLNEWKPKSPEDPNTYEVSRGDFHAVLNPDNGHVKIFGPDLFHEEYLSIGPINLKNYFKFLNNKIFDMNINFSVNTSNPSEVQEAIDSLNLFLGKGEAPAKAKAPTAAEKKKAAAKAAAKAAIKLDDVKAKVIALGKADSDTKPKMKAKLAELGGEGTRTSTLDAEHYAEFMTFLTDLEKSLEEEV